MTPTPAPDRPAGPPPDGGSPRSLLKVLVPLAVLLGVVFAVTFFSQYTPTEDEKKGTGQPGAANPGEEPPLRFFSSSRRWLPAPPGRSDLEPKPSLMDQVFPGFFEAGSKGRATFWFENRNREPVAMNLKGVSCSACSGGRLAPIPPDAARLLLQTTAVSALPTGLVSVAPLGIAGAAANLAPKLDWQAHEFKDPAAVVFAVPAADNADGWSPQWGVLELNFTVRPNPSIPLRAEFATQVKGTDRVGTAAFEIYFEPTHPFEVVPPTIDVGELTENSPPKTADILVGSATRGPGAEPPFDRLAEPAVKVLVPGGAGEPGPFVSVGTPAAVTGPELAGFASRLVSSRGPVRLLSAYRIPVTVSPRVGDARMDIGQLDREIWITVPDTPEPKHIKVKGAMRGSVWLSDAKEIDLGSFKGADGAKGSFELTVEKAGTEIGVVKDQTKPDFLQVTPERLPDRGDRGYYRLAVVVPPGKQYGPINDGVVVLEVKGPRPQRIRIPVKGRGVF